MEITTSQSKAKPEASARQEPETQPKSASKPRSGEEDDAHYDRSDDHVARVRRAKQAARRRMEALGDPSEYTVTIIKGQLKEDPDTSAQSPQKEDLAQ